MDKITQYAGHMLRYILLGFLNYRPMTGYELKTLIDHSTGHFWHAYHSQIYTTLRKLEEDGRLVSEEEEADDNKLNRRIYTITSAGQAELMQWLGEPLQEMSRVKEELLPRLFFSGLRDKAAILDELRHHRRLHQQKLVYYESIEGGELLSPQAIEANPAIAGEIPYWQMTLRFGRQYARMYLNWLDETIASVEAL